MHCPVCKLPLVTAEVDGVELDYCADGHGVWLDEGEIEVLLDRDRPVLKADLGGRRGRRRCPRCRGKMHVHEPVAGLELDVCPHGDGIWFDAGEVERLARALATDRQGGVVKRLDVAFARLRDIIGGHVA